MATKQQVNQALNAFYHNPVASVSTELLLTIAFGLILAVVAIQPTLQTMAGLSEEIEEKSKLNEQLQKKVAALNAAQTEYYRWQEQLSLLDTAIPAGSTVINDLKLLEKLAVDNSVVLSNISLSTIPDTTTTATVSAAQVSTLPISVNITGDYPAIRNYVDALLSNRRVFVVNAIMFGINKERGGRESLNATLSIDMPIYQ